MLTFAPLNPLSTRPHQNVVWYNNSWLGFLKMLNYVPNERKNFCKKWALIWHNYVAMAHRNYFRRNNLQILKLATYTKIEDHYSRYKLTTFKLERIAKCSYFILSTQNIKFYWFVMKIKKNLLPIWWYNKSSFPLGNKYFGVFVLNGLMVSDLRNIILTWLWCWEWHPKMLFWLGASNVVFVVPLKCGGKLKNTLPA